MKTTARPCAAHATPAPPAASAAPIAALWPIDRPRPNPLNPRRTLDRGAAMDELVASVRSQGLLQPILVTPAGLIIAGHRRHAACVWAGVRQIPVIIRDVPEIEQLELMLVENLHRKGLDVLETAQGCQGLRDRGRTLEQVAIGTGFTPDAVRKHLALLTLPRVVQDRCAAGTLPLGWVLDLCRLPTPQVQIRVAMDGIREGWTCEELARVVAKILGPPPRKYPVAVDGGKRQVTPLVEIIAHFTELVTTLQRSPELAREPAVQEWMRRLQAAVSVGGAV